MKRYLPQLGIALGLALAIYALFFSETDEDKVRAVLVQLEDTIRVTADDTNVVVRAARVRGQFKEMFTKEISFQIPELSNVSAGRPELTGLAAKAPQLWRTASVELGDLTITIDKPSLAALAVGDAVLTATRHDGQLEHDTRKISISLEKIEGDWRIVALSVSAKNDPS